MGTSVGRRSGVRADVVAWCGAIALSLPGVAAAQNGTIAVRVPHAAADAVVAGRLRAALSDTDMMRVFDGLTRLDLSGRSDAIRAARCVASGDCSTRYTPVAACVAPAALARALSRDADARRGIEAEARGLLEEFRARRHRPHVDVVEAVTFLLASATTVYAGAPRREEQVAFRRSLQRAVSRNGAFQVASDRERQVAAELCVILGMHLLREGAQHAASPLPQGEAVRRHAERVVHAALEVRLAELDWSRFVAGEER